jgi:hypothetical protein
VEAVSRYIDADILAEMVEEEFDGLVVYDVAPDEAVDDICDIINSCPTVDAAPVVHGHWKKQYLEESERYDLECSKCGFRIVLDYYDIQYACYCNSCGAKMESEGE